MKVCKTCGKKDFGADHRGSYSCDQCDECKKGGSMAKCVDGGAPGPVKKVALAKKGFGSKMPKMNAKKVPVKAPSKLYGG